MKNSLRTKAPLKKTGSKVDEILTIILVIAIICAIAMTIYVILTPKQGEKFTEFYVLGPNGTASDYPTNLKVGEEGEVIIGIVNHEYTNTLYRLKVDLSGVVIAERVFVLAHNETMESPFVFKVEKKGAAQKLEFLLYKDEEQPVYRSLHLWIDADESV